MARRRLTERLEEGRQTFQPALWLRLFGLGLIGIYLVLLVVLNTTAVKVRFVFATAKVSLIWVILLSLLIGLAAGVLLSQLHRHRQRSR
jgi:uncharacterized integral membrane protein